MTLLYNFGLTTGSLMAYLLESLLSPVQQYPCYRDAAHETAATQMVVRNITSATVLPAVTTTQLTTMIPSLVTVISNAIGNTTLESSNR